MLGWLKETMEPENVDRMWECLQVVTCGRWVTCDGAARHVIV